MARIRGLLLAAVVVLSVVAACSSGDSVGTVDSADDETTTTTGPPEDPAEDETTTTTAPVGPQTCGDVTTTIGTRVTVEIRDGAVDCAFAEGLLDTYYNDPPAPPEGSGAFVTIDDWECNSSSSQEPGRASTCRREDGGEIITVEPGDDTGNTGGTEGTDAEYGCEDIDQPTLDTLFPDGEVDEAVCDAYIGGENSIG